MSSLTITDGALLALRPGRPPVAIAPAGYQEHFRAARLVYRPATAAVIAAGEIGREAALALGQRYGLLEVTA